jgi:LacI family transcriptional regulator
MLSLSKKNAQPYYEQIKQSLRSEIRSGTLKPGSAIDDERSLALSLGVSRVTVRRALSALTQEGLLHRIRGKGTFVRASFAKQPRKVRAAVSVLMPHDHLSLNTLFHFRVLNGIHAGSESTGLFVTYRKLDKPYEACLAKLQNDPAVKALIVFEVDDKHFLPLLSELHLPVVLLDTPHCLERPLFDEVSHHSEPAAFDGTKRLLELGHRSIGLMISQSPSQYLVERRLGYRRALESLNGRYRPELIYPVPCTIAGGYECMKQIIARPSPPTAMFCANDELAAGAIAALRDNGWRVPQDMTVIGFGDLGLFTSPAMTTLRLPLEEMGLAAIKLVRERLKNPSAPIKRVFVPIEWVPRESHGPRLHTSNKEKSKR